MAKFYGKVGIVEYVEKSPGVWKHETTELMCSGNIKRKNNRSVNGEYLNDNLVVNNQISIIADPYINQHFPSIKYVEWNGVKWRVTNVDSHFPRLILTLGEVYNGKQT